MTDVFIGLFAICYLGALIYFLQRARLYGHSAFGIVIAFLFSPYAVVMGSYWIAKDLLLITRGESKDADDNRTPQAASKTLAHKLTYKSMTSNYSLEYRSPRQLESSMNSAEDFHHFYYSLYRCSPDEENDFNRRRNEVSLKYPDLALPFGDYFVLQGNAAAEILSTFYYSLTLVDDIDDEKKKYYSSRYQHVTERNQASQSLPFPLNLTEGQLGTDENMELMVHEAIMSKQITVWTP